MALWEYKVITSGVHGFATPALLESFLNNLGKDEWEIVSYLPSPANPLAFTGLVRRSVQRDWTPPAAVIPATSSPAQPAAPESAPSETSPEAEANPKSTIQNPKSPDALRPVRDTERDLDPDAQDDDDSNGDDEWDSLDLDDDLPTFFDALKPHMRNNQKGPGQSVAVDYLSKRWELREAEILGALKECGLTIPETEDADPEYFEFEDDLFWVNRSNRGQYFINTREKPRPVFRTVPATPLSPDDPAYAELAAERAEEKALVEKRNAERAAQQAAATARAEEAAKRRAEAQAAKDNAESLPAAAQSDAPPQSDAGTPADASTEKPLLDRIRPMMRRNRHGPGYSGSVGFLARALKTTDADLAAQLAALGLHIPEAPNEKPAFVEIGANLYWLNKDNRGNIWINGRDNKNGAKKAAPAEASLATPEPNTEIAATSAPASQQLELTTAGTTPVQPEPPAPAEAIPQSEIRVLQSPLAAVRPLLKPNKRGNGVSGETGYLSRALEQSETQFVAALTQAGLVVPPDVETKPIFVEHEGEIFWFSLYDKDGETSIWLNAKSVRAKRKTAGAPRSRKPKAKPAE